uniref:Uncharacterized protein n=1 Tax=Zea mays TaxID=4577 RepID=A0A804NWX1_MAIZE|eukprot:XP_020408322.1 uncharacterized protein LOC103654177 isoform X2 [Zea mays]
MPSSNGFAATAQQRSDTAHPRLWAADAEAIFLVRQEGMGEDRRGRRAANRERREAAVQRTSAAIHSRPAPAPLPHGSTKVGRFFPPDNSSTFEHCC